MKMQLMSKMFEQTLEDKKVLHVSEWETPASHYKEGQVGNYRLIRQDYTKGYYKYHCMDGYVWYYVEDTIPLMRLQEFREGEWHHWMLDDPMNYRCMQKYAEAAEGNVLTTGLGLGLLAHELDKNDKVESVTIVERSPEVRELVWGYVPKQKTTLVMGDFYEFIEQDTHRWDMIVVDLWVFNTNLRQLQLFEEESYPAYLKIKDKYPEAKLVFHGFKPITDVIIEKPYFECNPIK